MGHQARGQLETHRDLSMKPFITEGKVSKDQVAHVVWGNPLGPKNGQ